MIASANNPYVGPRAFTQEEHKRFFGREREARELLARVISERLTLFYAQSGAGKTSLINTRLIPQLRKASYSILPIGRVGGELPEKISDVDDIFIFNLMLELGGQNQTPDQLAQMNLTDFIGNLINLHIDNEATSDEEIPVENDEEAPYVLIIDQFEEIFTTHPARWQEREDFFRQLNKAMIDNPLLWVVLILREDYIAALEPYTHILEDNMRARFYMQRMGHEAALEAIKKPAEQGGQPFAPDVAETLVDNLRKIPLLDQQIDGLRLDQFVEPMQLQVVCYRLWENLNIRPTHEITHQDLEILGDVDQALTTYYTETLGEVLKQPKINERQLRNWFSNKLITPARTRGLVYRGKMETEGIPNKVIDILNEAYIIRTNTRGNDTWYELTHDRLIEPILEANRRWQEIQPLFQDAQEWSDFGQVRKKLYKGTQLKKALELADTNLGSLSEIEKAFLKASEQQEEEQKQKRQRWWLLTLIGVILMLIVILMLFMWTAAILTG